MCMTTEWAGWKGGEWRGVRGRVIMPWPSSGRPSARSLVCPCSSGTPPACNPRAYYSCDALVDDAIGRGGETGNPVSHTSSKQDRKRKATHVAAEARLAVWAFASIS